MMTIRGFHVIPQDKHLLLAGTAHNLLTPQFLREPNFRIAFATKQISVPVSLAKTPIAEMLAPSEFFLGCPTVHAGPF